METGASQRWRAIVLAGERPGGSPLSAAAGVAAGVLVPVAGIPCVVRVITALRGSGLFERTVLCGPHAEVVAGSAELRALLADGDPAWIAPARGPAASALAGLAAAGAPSLLTAGDHALLTPAMVRDFCARAAGLEADFVVGLVPYARVAARYPQSRRTVLRFRDGGFCGSNLFAIMAPAGGAALRFWSAFEADRKRPWRIARRMGLPALIRYLARSLTVHECMQLLSERAGCRIRHLPIEDCHAAIDVDSVADWKLAESIVNER